MSLAFRIAIYPKGLIKCLNYFIVFRTVDCIMIYKDALCPVTYITLLVGEIFVKGIVAKAIQSIKVHHNALNVDNRY